MQLLSPAFGDGGNIPQQYTCKGQNVSPPLNITDVPAGTKSLALVMHDPDAVSGDFVHWLLWNVAPITQSINANSAPSTAIQGLTGFGNNKYGGPCPPAGTGTHHYMFELYALDTTINLSPDSSRQKLEEEIKGHVITQTTLTGLVTAT